MVELIQDHLLDHPLICCVDTGGLLFLFLAAWKPTSFT